MGKELLTATAGETLLLLGNEAIARGALEGGVRFVTCYPGTPSSEVPDTFFRLSEGAPYYFEYSVNEKVALEVGGGAALAGLPTLVTMKHVGVNVAADPLMTLAYVSAPGGLVLLSADDPGCHSSQNEQDNRIYARLGGLPCFEPATAQECKDMARDALALSRRLETPVLLRTTTRVNHVRGPVTVGAMPQTIEEKPFVKDPARFVPLPASARVMHPRLLKVLEAARAEAEASPYNTETGAGDVGFISSGVARNYLADVLEEDGLTGTVRVLELGLTYPLPEGRIAAFLAKCRTVVIVEELEPVLETEIRALAQKRGIAVVILGKGEHLPRNGEFSTANVRLAVHAVLGRETAEADTLSVPADLPKRPPNLCAGCPHRAAYYAVREVYGDTAVYSSDIGCYTLGFLPPFRAADFLLCMGSSISTGAGFARASGKPVVAFIGDSTFFHSGITGLVDAVAYNHDILIVILDNRTTAMTGHQPNPGVDTTIFGENPNPVDLMALIRACGIEPVKVNPLNHKATVAALTAFSEQHGPRVLVAEYPCPIHARRMGQAKKTLPARVAGDPEACLAVRDNLACPAFAMVDGAFSINAEQCDGCMYCVQLSADIKPGKKEAR
ncbi:indolepyruvate ferredoxin oxidoreductase, alpha subunit [Solidesulfovibrio carbinoliphilus subsp. oakridgensis]|uniref:Indolepyruvate oxidoreductase subunit IorA n=1 Tax=Solidesulfovibrio carbinoliphilus subsp. oakridgensis TaxID=694327 RepID=G7Q499_9BACT|nr:indolepyruvate ferredoxin oxidoreductase subunit alpha [Solidesulfovibrio carbinoliphilus]EHJ46967.1 indolepyruvate ferredoxin oxidoreductase, alpha subunit [Solidesulfovibrio carbinoliphilus subsp. oakridgensis]